MFIEGKEIYEQNRRKVSSISSSSELVIVPLNEHHNLLSFNCSNSELND